MVALALKFLEKKGNGRLAIQMLADCFIAIEFGEPQAIL